MHYIFVNYISASIYSDVVMIVFNNLKLYLGKFIIYGNYDTLSGKKICLEYLFFWVVYNYSYQYWGIQFAKWIHENCVR